MRRAAVLSACVMAWSGSPTPQSRPLLMSVCEYVDAYEQQLSVVIGSEDYTQLVFEPGQTTVTPARQPAAREVLRQRRRLRSEFAIVRLPTDDKRWVGIRDVFQVDGRPVPDRSGRVAALLKLPFGAAEDQWRALQEESARFNIGDVRRTLNVPTFALMFLRCDNQRRFAFDPPRADGTAVVVDYREVQRPAFIRDEHGEDELARGLFRADPNSGAVTGTSLSVGIARSDVRAQIDVTFAMDPKLRLLVPRDMREQYWTPSGQRVEGTARYSNFKRFEVEATWKVR